MIVYTKKDFQLLLPQSEEKSSELCKRVKLDGDNVICIAGRPGMGKTALALYMALEYSKTSSKAVHIFSLEMSAEQIIDRLLITLSEVDSYRFRQKAYSDEEKERIEQARKQLSQMNLIIDDTIGLTVGQIEEKTEKVDNLGLIIIDYFQLLLPDKKTSDREQEYYEMERQLHFLSKRKGIPVIFTSQLPRRVEYRKDKRPRLSDLDGTGVSENNTDTICLVYREGYYYPFEKTDEAEIIISKNEYGNCETVPLKWQGEFAKFSE